MVTAAHNWTIHTDPVLNATVSRVNPVFTNSLFSVMLTAGGGGTSALSVNASAALNGVYIVCSDGNGLTSDIQEAVAMVAGKWDCYPAPRMRSEGVK